MSHERNVYMALTQRFHDALIFIAKKHGDQVTNNTVYPYISHLMGVTSLVMEYGGDEDEAIAALLHGFNETQDGPEALQEIEAQFGKNVAEIVRGCNDADNTADLAWRPRKEAYLKHLQTASPSIRLVAAADKLYNARNLVANYRAHGTAIYEKCCGGRDGLLWYYKSLVRAFRSGKKEQIVEEFARVVADLTDMVDLD
jgi:(p)ppGpp synthase/HD superfamily hydrolase